MDECRFLVSLFYENRPGYFNRDKSQFLRAFINDLLKWSESKENDHEEIYKEMIKKCNNDFWIKDFGEPKVQIKEGKMSYEDIIYELEENYKDHERFEEMMSDVKSYTDDKFIEWGKNLYSVEFGNNTKLASGLLELVLENLKVNNDIATFVDVANVVASSDGLNDKVWAKELYLTAQNAVEDSASEEALTLAGIAAKVAAKEYMNDKEWAKNII